MRRKSGSVADDGSPAKPLSLAEFGVLLASLARFEAPPFLSVAVSGGPDSLALAILADGWARERGGEICALTVDHRLRPESSAEIGRLQAWLSARAIRHEVLIWAGEKPKTGIQEAARIARYRLLAGWCRDHGCLHLLTAHQREDQVETNLIRRRAHSGADGLAGMSAIRETACCRVLRPLLGVPRSRLQALLESEGQPFIKDPSNVDPAFERSRYRGARSAMPGVADLPDLLAGIRIFGLLRSERERDVNAFLGRSVSVHPAGFALIDPGLFSTASHELAERVLSAIIITIGGAFYPPRRERVARLRAALCGATPRGQTLGGCRFIRWRERFLVIREIARAAEPIQLNPGGSISWDRRYEVMLPATASSPLTIGYLGSAGFTRLGRPALQPERSSLPRLLLPIFPASWDDDGIATVPHLNYRRQGVADLPQFIFRPVNPLTQAGFAVV